MKTMQDYMTRIKLIEKLKNCIVFNTEVIEQKMELGMDCEEMLYVNLATQQALIGLYESILNTNTEGEEI